MLSEPNMGPTLVLMLRISSIRMLMTSADQRNERLMMVTFVLSTMMLSWNSFGGNTVDPEMRTSRERLTIRRSSCSALEPDTTGFVTVPMSPIRELALGSLTSLVSAWRISMAAFVAVPPRAETGFISRVRKDVFGILLGTGTLGSGSRESMINSFALYSHYTGTRVVHLASML